MVNEHNGKIPRYFWAEDWERKAIHQPRLSNKKRRPSNSP
jgi:hypothetical protein